MSTVIGIDAGLDGALVANTNGTLGILDMPTITVGKKRHIDGYAVRAWLIHQGAVDHVALEEVAARPGAGVAGMFNFGAGYGLLQGILIALDRPWSLVRPNRWTAALGVGADKGRHREEAMRRFPGHAEMFQRVKDDGRADAALLTVWLGERG